MDPRISIEKRVLRILFHLSFFVLGIICYIFIKVFAPRTIIGPFVLSSLYVVAIFIGYIVFKRTLFLNNFLQRRKLKLRHYILSSLLTFGPVVTGGFLFLNNAFKGKEHTYRAFIVATKFVKHVQRYSRHNGQYHYNYAYKVSFQIMGRVKPIELGDAYKDIIDNTDYINIKCKKGLFGYYVVTGFQFDAQP